MIVIVIIIIIIIIIILIMIRLLIRASNTRQKDKLVALYKVSNVEKNVKRTLIRQEQDDQAIYTFSKSSHVKKKGGLTVVAILLLIGCLVVEISKR